MAEKLLSTSDWQSLSAEFARHSSEIGMDVDRAFEQLAARILQLNSVDAPASVSAK